MQVDVALKDAAAGPLTMQVKQFGLSKPDEVSLHSYAEAGHLDSFTIDAGDHRARCTVPAWTRLPEPGTEWSAVFARHVESRGRPG